MQADSGSAISNLLEVFQEKQGDLSNRTWPRVSLGF